MKKRSTLLNTSFFLHLFFSLFYFVGIKTVTEGINKDNQETIIAGISFMIIPMILHFLSYKSISFQRNKIMMLKKYKETPWMIRQDWREKRSKSSSDNLIAFYILIIFSFILIGLGYLILTGNEFHQLKRSSPLISKLIYLLPIGGVLSIIHAIKSFITITKFGTSHIKFNNDFVELGEELNALLHIKKKLNEGAIIEYNFSCKTVKQVYSGKETRQYRKTLWEQSWNSPITGQGIYMGHPVKVIVPKDLPETRELQRKIVGDDTILDKVQNSAKQGVEWILTVKIDLNGIDYSDRFELPVFKGNSTHLSTHSLDNILEDKLKKTNTLNFIKIEKSAQTQVLDFNVSKGNTTAFYIFIFGLFFLSPGIFLLSISDYSNLNILAVTKIFMGSVFTLAGSGIILASLITISFSIQLAINNNNFNYRRYHLFGRTLVDFNNNDFQSIKRKSNMSAGSTKFFDIILYIDKFQKTKFRKLVLNIPSELEVRFIESVLKNPNEIDKIKSIRS